jgi:hypothetical protein
LEDVSTKRAQPGQILWQRSLNLGYSRWQLFKGLAAAVIVVSVHAVKLAVAA